ncbi:MAG TPA: DUF4349 domain-containing protein [Gaiellaceae bacterium]
MSQPDLMTQLRDSRPIAPDEVREQVRRIAAQAAAPPRTPIWRPQMTWRRSLAVLVPLAAAAAGAAFLLPGSGNHPAAAESVFVESPPSTAADGSTTTNVNTTTNVFSGSLTGAAAAPPPLAPPLSKAAGTQRSTSQQTLQYSSVPGTNPARVQRVNAELQLRVPNTQAVSDGSKQAVAIARALGGYPSRLNVNAVGRTGYAELTFRIPKQNLQKAINRLSALGTIMGENVSIQDIQSQVDATTRKLARLQAQRAAWQAQTQTPETQQRISALTDQIVRLRHGRNATIRAASYATLGLEMTTREAPAPLHAQGKGHFHGLGVAFRWIGICAVYGLALGAPVALLLALFWFASRGVRRRREDALLSRA